ncbi:MAG: hypothetical protein KGL35_18560, partial [Bradyrhizobium sp.]|nr:hypothetical protein [Bradyrhizobium sp.]
MAFDLERVRARLEAIPADFANKVARAGFFPAAVYESGTHVAYVAAIQEFGAPERNIPPRPFMRPAIEQHKAEWVQAMGKAVAASTAGAISADDALDRIGDKVASDIQATLENGSYAPLSPTTVLLRKWRREGRTITGRTVGEAAAAVAADPSLIEGVNADPLRDTGLLIASVSHDVS